MNITINGVYNIAKQAHGKYAYSNWRISGCSCYCSLMNVTCVPDTRGLEVRSHGDWQASALHLLPSDDSRNHWNSHGCATYIWICGSRPNNSDLSREMRTRGSIFMGFGHLFTKYIWRVSSSIRMVCFWRSSSKCHLIKKKIQGSASTVYSNIPFLYIVN